MDGTMHTQDGEHIWLRYATQFTAGERSHTIEIGIAVPVGASAEQRERLLQEAEAGMSQLTGHIENRVARMLRQAPAAQDSPSAPPAAIKAQPPRPASKPVAAQPPAPVPAQPRTQIREQMAAHGDGIAVPPTRQHIGASMPSAPGVISDNSGNLPLPQFIQHIKESLGLNPRQAMDLLKVKSLAGVNLREALEQLQNLVAHDQAGASDTAQPPAAARPASVAERPAMLEASAADAPPVSTPAAPSSPERGIRPVVHDEHPALVFDEEIEPEEEDELDDLDLEPDMTAEEQEKASAVLSRLREMRGANTASSARLQALHNVIDSQISAQQLQALIEGVWAVTNLKRLKVDQVEALISWAKEDDFVGEAEGVLALLEEERYARGNR